MADKKKAIIIGGLGYVGDPLIKLLKDQYELTVVDPNWFDNKHRYDAVNYIETSSFEINEIDAELCIYLAAVSNDPMGATYSEQTHSINCLEAVRLAELCKLQDKTVRFVLASSCSVYGASGDHAKTETDSVLPLTDYAKSKINAEKKLQEISGDNLKIICLRFATACGSSKSTRLDLALNDFVITALGTGSIEVLSDGTPWRPFIHIKDMSLAIKHSLEAEVRSPFEVFNVGSNEFTYTIKQLAEKIGELTDANVSINHENTTDARSYTVDFQKFKVWYNGSWPTMDLQATVLELTKFYSDTTKKYGLDHFRDFRNSRTYCRLKTLQAKPELFSNKVSE